MRWDIKIIAIDIGGGTMPEIIPYEPDLDNDGAGIEILLLSLQVGKL
jgi:hypothetical protein